jgi:hypothetical protein
MDAVGGDQFEIQLGVVDMGDFKRPVTVPGSRRFQVPMERFMDVCGPAALSLESSVMGWPMGDS